MFAAFGEAAQDVMLQIKLMPLLVLAAQICPDSIEGTLFAFIMGVLNHTSTTRCHSPIYRPSGSTAIYCHV